MGKWEKASKMARLEYCLVTPDIHAKILKYWNSFGYRSNPSLIGIELNIERGKGFWKFNSAMLKDQDCVCKVGEK